MNKQIARANLAMSKDEKLKSIYMREVRYWYTPYEDGSGASVNMEIEFRDNKTGGHATMIFDQYGFEWEVSQYLNDFACMVLDKQRGHWPPLHWVELKMPFDIL